MGIDKFGRYTRKEKGLVGPKGEGFQLTRDGDYDMQNKRLCNVEDPLGNTDAINFKTHAESLLNCITKQDGHFDAQNVRLCNISRPTEGYDAVTKEYMEMHTPIKLKDAYSIHQYRLQDVAAPISSGDAINLDFFNENTIRANNGVINASNCTIQNVAPPKTGKDAVNLEHVNANVIVKNKNGAFDAKNATIENLAPPTKGGDAVTKAYLEQQIPIPGRIFYNFRNKRLGQVAAPSHIYDAVNLEYFQKKTIGLQTADDDTYWTAGNKRLKQLAKPYDLSDAATKRYVKETVGELAYSLSKKINQNKRVQLASFDDWQQQVVKETATWDELFDVPPVLK